VGTRVSAFHETRSTWVFSIMLRGNFEDRQEKLDDEKITSQGSEGCGSADATRDLAHGRLGMLLCVAVFSLFVWPAVTLPAQSKPESEFEVKAAFLYSFTRLVEWPQSSLGEAGPSNVCVLGQDSFGHVRDEPMKGRVVENQRILWVRARRPQDLPACLLPFISASESSQVAEWLSSVRNRSVLTVGDTRGFAAAGGTLELTVESNRVCFAINLDAADRAGLKISSKLLALARTVHDSAGSADGRG
jgi:hypothetical protein